MENYGFEWMMLLRGRRKSSFFALCKAVEQQTHPPSPSTSRAHTVPQGVRPPTGSGSRPYVPAVQGGGANTRTLAAEMPQTSMASGNTPLVVLRPHSESSRPTPRRCWRSLGPLSRAVGARLNNNNNNNSRHILFDKKGLLIRKGGKNVIHDCAFKTSCNPTGGGLPEYRKYPRSVC